METKWNIAPEPNPEKVTALSLALGIDRVLAQLLVQRGIETFEQARKFFRPSLEDLHDPFLMKDLDVAVERLHKAITGGEKILVYGDYDVDGTTAVSLVYSFIKRYSPDVDFYIPARYDEGYGLSVKGIETAEKGGYTLIITLDCGIKAIQKIGLAKEKGIDVIVCDHHLPEEELPPAVAVLDPKRSDDSYPFDDLCGCGVGFKLVQGYSQKYGIPFDTLVPLLDLCAVSIASDLVLMTGENRILAHYGLKTLNENPRNGFRALMNLSNLEPGHVSIDDIVFKLGPRINAAGRMESGRLAVELLTAEEQGQAMIIAQRINENNNNRKNIDREITAEALEMVESGKALASENATIVYSPEWNKGVVGIVASRLVEAFYKPTVVLTKSNGFIRPQRAGLRPLFRDRELRGPSGELRRAHVCRRPHHEGRESARIRPPHELLRVGQGLRRDAGSGGRHRRPPLIRQHHPQVLPHSQAVPAFRPGQHQSRVHHRKRVRFG